MPSSTSDAWEDEGFGGEDDWEAPESLESGLEDDEEDELDVDELEEEEPEGEDDLELGL